MAKEVMCNNIPSKFQIFPGKTLVCVPLTPAENSVGAHPIQLGKSQLH